MEILLIRHGLPVRIENEDGSPADPPLGEPGAMQATAVARWLTDERIDAIYSSPLRRAAQTAEPLAKAKGLDVVIEPGVTEIDHDAASYVPLEEIKANAPARWRAARAQAAAVIPHGSCATTCWFQLAYTSCE